MEETILVDPSQFACCGDTFGLGDRVAWKVRDVDDVAFLLTTVGPGIAASLSGVEERHNDEVELRAVEGVVRAAVAVGCRYELTGRMWTPVAGTTTVEPRHDGTIETWPDLVADHHLVGIVVTIAADE